MSQPGGGRTRYAGAKFVWTDAQSRLPHLSPMDFTGLEKTY